MHGLWFLITLIWIQGIGLNTIVYKRKTFPALYRTKPYQDVTLIINSRRPVISKARGLNRILFFWNQDPQRSNNKKPRKRKQKTLWSVNFLLEVQLYIVKSVIWPNKQIDDHLYIHLWINRITNKLTMVKRKNK